MTYELRLYTRRESRSSRKAFTKREFLAFVQPVLNNFPMEETHSFANVKTFAVPISREEASRLRQALTAAYRRVTQEPSFGLHVHGPEAR